jgi:hypothetical protein
MTTPLTPLDLSIEQRNAYEMVLDLFKQFGLDSLAPQILKMVQSGYDSTTVSVMLQETKEYKTRFAANELRKNAGLSVLSPAEYIQQERGYRQVLESFGFPSGFYDQPSDFENWIAQDVSVNEINERATIGMQAVTSTDPFYLQALKDMGLGEGDVLAAVLDRDRALPILQKVVKTSQIASEAYRQGIGITEARANYFAGLGVTQEQARQGYQAIGEVQNTATKLGEMFDESFGVSDLEEEILGGSGMASEKRKRLASREAGQFAGAGAGAKQTTRETKGSY